MQPPDSPPISDILLALGAVVCAIVVLGWFAKRVLRVPSGGAGPLRIAGGLSMGPREKVVLMQVGRTWILLGVAPGRIQTLHVLDEAPVPAEDFANHLAGPPARPGMPGALASLLGRLTRGSR
jgi:flagellar protein FliO/FliZ